ncbi:MAG: hypothetical protein V3R17_07830 [Hyphomicrobium sp.]
MNRPIRAAVLLVAIAAFLLVALKTIQIVATRDRLEEGSAAYWRGDYTAALQEFKPLAEQGIAEAQYSVGTYFLSLAG